VLAYGRLTDDELLGDGGVGVTLSHQSENLAFTLGQGSKGPVVATSGEQVTYDIGVDDRATRGDAVEAVEEVTDVAHPVLEQVADARVGAGGGRVEQVSDVGLGDVGGQQDDRDVGVLGADRDGGAESLVGMGGGMRMSVMTTSGWWLAV
jgi:hypothetical protein